MRWTNYHGHSNYCDGHGMVEDYVIKAIELNMASIGISSHAPLPFSSHWTMPLDKLEQYNREVEQLKEKYKDQIQIFRSLEVDYIPGVVSPTHSFIKEQNLDYTIGSVHVVGAFEDGLLLEIDGPTPEFEKGLDILFDSDIKALARKYFSLQNEMLENHTPDILGHMDKIKMHNHVFNFFEETEDWYVNLVHQTMMLAKEKGSVIEINTKTFERSNLIFPGADHFKFIKQNSIPVTINSDAHRPEFLTMGFTEVADMLMQVGIKEVYEFVDGDWIPVKFIREGILI